MTDFERSAEAIADQLQSNLEYLQPPEEARFDPATLAVIVALYVLRNIADGIAEGIKESARNTTESLLSTIATKIRHLVHRDVPASMTCGVSDAELDKAVAQTKNAWTYMHQALNTVDAASLAQVSAHAAALALAAAGLPAQAAERVEGALVIQVGQLLNDT